MKIGIVGSGFVGATAGYALVMQGVGRVTRIVDVMVHDQRAILIVCMPMPDVCGVSDVTVSLPRLVGGKGVIETFPLPLNDSESNLLRASAQVVRDALDQLRELVQ